MTKHRVTIHDLLDDLDGLHICLEREDSEWMCSAQGELLSEITDVPAETPGAAIENFRHQVEERVCEIMVRQLTTYQLAVLLSTLLPDHHGFCNWKRFQPVPMHAAASSVTILESIGLLACTGNVRSYIDYGPLGPGRFLASSGYELTPWGEIVMAHLRFADASHRPKVAAALAKLRMTPESKDA